jgi:signal transduction histidine kinase
MKHLRSQYWSLIAPFTLALATLLLMIGVVWQFALLSYVGVTWSARSFGVLAWWFGPLALLFHLYFPVFRSVARWLVPVLVSVATAGSLLEMLGDPVVLRAEVPALYTLRLLWLLGCLLGVVLVLIQTYRHAPSPVIQRHIGVVAVGGAVAFLPLLTLSFLPRALLGQPFLPYEFAFCFLLLLPLTYGYAIFRSRLVRVDRYLSRGAAAILVTTLLSAMYLLLYSLLLRLLPLSIWRDQTIPFVIAMLLAVTVGPAHRQLKRLVNGLLYGGWYDYRSAIQNLSEALDQATHSTALAQHVCEAIQTVMQLEWTSLLVFERSGALRKTVISGTGCAEHQIGAEWPPSTSRIIEYFRLQSEPVDSGTLQSLLVDSSLDPTDRHILNCTQTQLWLPLIAADRLVGLFILGPKRGSYTLDAIDREILQVVARQASMAVQNVQLINELRQRALDSERLHQQLLQAREAERTRVARELHDDVIQELVGLNYHLAELRTIMRPDYSDYLVQLQEHVRQIIGDVRGLCADLRPPALDSLGLVAAIRYRVRVMQQLVPFNIRLIVQGDEDQPLPEEIALCLFRVVQEALANAQKHAAPSDVEIRLVLAVDDVWLSIVDDGSGFCVPVQLERLLDQQHFGLVGLRERLELVQGTLEVTSVPGQGTCLRIWVPLPPMSGEPQRKDAWHDQSVAIVE